MSNLVESLQMCMWFDVNIISRRNLLAAAVSSIAVSLIMITNAMIHQNYVLSLLFF